MKRDFSYLKREKFTMTLENYQGSKWHASAVIKISNFTVLPFQPGLASKLLVYSVMIIVVMGVAGCGKSTVGKLLANRLSLPFLEADDFHSQENISKMSRGIPLTDEDRYPWLISLSNELKKIEPKKGAVLACSALKEKYRQMLQQGLKEEIRWIYLNGSEKILRERMENRKEHFMPEELLRSQLSTLEIPTYAYSVSIEKKPEDIVNEVVPFLKH